MNQYQVTVKPYELFDWLDGYVRENKTAFPQSDGTYLRLERWEGIDRTAIHPEYWRGRRKKTFWLMVTYSSQPTASRMVKALNRKVEKAVEFCLSHPSYKPILTIRCDKAELQGWLANMIDQCVREGIIIPLDQMDRKTTPPAPPQDELAGSVGEKEPRPWDSLPDKDRKIIELWRAGATSKEIAQLFDLYPHTIDNKISALRKRYGEEIVPYRRKE